SISVTLSEFRDISDTSSKPMAPPESAASRIMTSAARYRTARKIMPASQKHSGRAHV
ncbi:MAG: hypothetical protein HQK92_16450, partial [Nitrospirae bacterium]|nr:hypothetical protein [Nitrospirota bacterium]